MVQRESSVPTFSKLLSFKNVCLNLNDGKAFNKVYNSKEENNDTQKVQQNTVFSLKTSFRNSVNFILS